MFRLIEQWLLFPGKPIAPEDWHPEGLEFEDVYFAADDGTQLHGWYVPHPQPRAVMLYSHGNGECVPHLAERLQILHDLVGVAVLGWDYRGYGRSQGKPCEKNIIADARAAQLWLAKRAGVAPEEIVLMGRSLGGAVAVAVAAEHPVRALVLDRTFADLTETAAHRFPWLPVERFMKNRFPSLERIRNYRGPLLQLHGSEDTLVPLKEGRRLFDATPSENKHFIEIVGGGHFGPLLEDSYQDLRQFLSEL